MNKKDNTDYKHVLLSSIANARGLKYYYENQIASLEIDEVVTEDSNKIAKELLGQTATVKDLESLDSIVNYVKKLPSYETLVSEARKDLSEYGIDLPENKYIETFETGSIGWMRQLINICK